LKTFTPCSEWFSTRCRWNEECFRHRVMTENIPLLHFSSLPLMVTSRVKRINLPLSVTPSPVI
jgi:hypothetical protein